MPPTFFLVMGLIFVALLAPFVLVIALVMAARPATRRVGLRALSGGLMGALVLIGIDLALSLALEGTVAASTPGGLLFSSALGFNAGICWRAIASYRRRSRMSAPGARASEVRGRA